MGGDDDADVEAGDVSGSGVQGAESTAAAANSGASRRDDGSNSAAAAVEILVDSTLLRPMQAEISSLVSECAPTSRSSESNRTSVPQPATAAAAAAPRGGIAGDSIGDNGGGVSGGAAASASHSRADRLVAHGGWVITVDVDAGKQLGMGMLGASVVQDGSMYGTFVTKTLPSKAAAEAGIQRGDILAALKIHLANPLRDGANLKANLAGWGMTVNESGWTPLLYKKELSAVKALLTKIYLPRSHPDSTYEVTNVELQFFRLPLSCFRAPPGVVEFLQTEIHKRPMDSGAEPSFDARLPF
eukprot:gene30472-21071_t